MSDGIGVWLAVFVAFFAFVCVAQWLAHSLARLHLLLDDLGRPMYSPATHPMVNDGAPAE